MPYVGEDEDKELLLKDIAELTLYVVSLFKGRKKDAKVDDVLEARHDTCGEAQQVITVY
jgi:hypothetical protein